MSFALVRVRVMPKTSRVLVIDEIQSNRHQDAREKGYKGHGSEYERLKQQVQNTQDAYFEQIEEYARTADGRLDITKLNRAKEDDPLSKALWEQWSKDERALRQYNESHGFSESSAIPAAPFEKNWHEVAMKRMLRLAAEEGFDKVAWTTGAQQAERYGIGGVVESITKGKTRGEKTLVSVQYKNGKQDSWVVAPGGKVVDGGITTGENLSDLIGKELSEKVMSLDENGSISGNGLRIGGEGMKGFYDQILPRFMDKYGKKWGVKTGEVELSTPGNEVMHSVDVTAAMRRSVLSEGQPLFQREETIRFSLRTKPAPKKTEKVYKLMRLGADGQLYPLFIDSAEPVRLGVWYDADSPNLSSLRSLSSDVYTGTKTETIDGEDVKVEYRYGVYLIDNTTGEAVSLEDFKRQHKGDKSYSRMGNNPNKAAINWATSNNMRWIKIEQKKTGQKRYGGESRSYYNYGITGAKGGGAVGLFALRPGWHAGSLPTMRQIGKGAGKNLRDDRFVWVEGRVSADNDYNAEAQSNPDKDIPDRIPEDGFYLKSTNANAAAAQADRVGWYVAGAFMPERIIGDREARAIIDEWNAAHPEAEPVEYDFPRESGKEFDAETMSLVEPMREERGRIEDDAQAFHDVIDEMFDNENFDKSAHARERYDLGVTPDWMKGVGISGERFTLSFKNIKTHLGKDPDHNLTAQEWHELPSALKHPFLVTSYGKEKGKFRLYTTIKVGNKFAVVGVDVVRVNQGKGVPMLELNRIKTVFGRDRYVVENGERILAWDKNITPEQEALLRGHNYREYPTIQELSSAKVMENFDVAKENGENVADSGVETYTAGDGSELPYRSARQLTLSFDEQSGDDVSPFAPQGEAETTSGMLSRMSDDELLAEVGRESRRMTTLYSEEYDRRHAREYNEAYDRVRAMLENEGVSEDDAGVMLDDIVRRWRDGYAGAERTQLRAQFDAVGDYFTEKEQERIEREDEEAEYREREEDAKRAAAARRQEQETVAAQGSSASATEDAGLSGLTLRKLKKGETCNVERRYESVGHFNFMGREKVESAADIAYIFRQLETSAIENSFLVLIKDGKPTIIHVGMGTYNQTVVHLGAGWLAASQLKPDSVIVVHNHPSGALNPSNNDVAMLKRSREVFGEDVVKDGIIIDTVSGTYSEFNTYGDALTGRRASSVDGEVPHKVYSFSKQVFAEGWDPTTASKVRNSDDVAAFISSHRLGEHKKVSLLVIGQDNTITANVFLPWTDLNRKAKEIADTVATYVHQMGGVGAILYGSGAEFTDSGVAGLNRELKTREVRLIDIVTTGGSMIDRYGEAGGDRAVRAGERDVESRGESGTSDIRYRDGGADYYDVVSRLRELAGVPKHEGWGSHYVHGETEDGRRWTIRLSDHPARYENFENNDEADGSILSLVLPDYHDYPLDRGDFEAIDDENADAWGSRENMVRQAILPYDALDMDKLREVIEEFKRTGEVGRYALADAVDPSFDEGEMYSDRETVEGDFLFRGGESGLLREDAAALGAARERVLALAERLGLDVVIVDDMSADERRRLTERQRRARGMYDMGSGRVYVNLGNHRTAEDALLTALHEGVAHHGLRALFGERFDAMLEQVYREASPETRAAIDEKLSAIREERARQRGGSLTSAEERASLLEAVDETLADVAEDMGRNDEFSKEWYRQLWESVKQALRDVARAVGLRREMSDGELRYMLWSSYHNLERESARKGRTIAQAQDIAARERYGVAQRDEQWREEGVRYIDEMTDDEISRHLRDVKVRYGLKSRSVLAVINTEKDLESLRGKIEDEVFNKIVEKYHDDNVFGCSQAQSGVIYIFPRKQETMEEVEGTWWHESTHIAWSDIEMADKEECGRAALEYLKKYDAYHYDMIMQGGYTERERPEEAACRLVQHIIKKYGAEAFLHDEFVCDNEKVAKLAAVLQYYFNNGQEKTNNRFEQSETGTTGESYGRSDVRRETGNDSGTGEANVRGAQAGETDSPRINSEHGEGDRSSDDRRGIDDKELSPIAEDIRYRDGEGAVPVDDSTESPEDAAAATREEREELVYALSSWPVRGYSEALVDALAREASDHSENVEARRSALHEISKELHSWRERAARVQREFDRATVDRLVSLARAMLTANALNGLTRGEVKRLLSVINRSVGTNDLTEAVNTVAAVCQLIRLQLMFLAKRKRSWRAMMVPSGDCNSKSWSSRRCAASRASCRTMPSAARLAILRLNAIPLC